MVSMKEIAAACGVSVATVSKALNDRKDVGEETKEMVRKVANEMGYFPTISAQSLRTNKTYNIGVLFMDEANSGLTHDYFAAILQHFKVTAELKGYDITMINCAKDRPRRMSYLNHCRYRGFDGVVIACIDFDSPEIAELIQSDIPVLTIDHIFNNRSAVCSDNIEGITEVVEYIVKMGHKKIAYVHGKDSAVTRDRLSTFNSVCKANKIDIPAEYLTEAPYRDIDSSYARTKELLALKNPPTCIMYPDDYSAFGGINAVHDLGLNIPEDISIVGYDGIQLALRYSPKMTTMVQNTERIGRVAAEKLIEQIENPEGYQMERITVEPSLHAGETVLKLN